MTPSAEIVLGRIVGEVGERQHDDGRDARAGRRGALAGQDPPHATANQDKQCGHRCGERRQAPNAFRRGGLHYRRGLCLYGDADPQRMEPLSSSAMFLSWILPRSAAAGSRRPLTWR